MALRPCPPSYDLRDVRTLRSLYLRFLLIFFALALFIFTCNSVLPCSIGHIVSVALPRSAPRAELTGYDEASDVSPTALECFQVSQPVLTPGGVPVSDLSTQGSCQVLLMDHIFASSCGTPFVGTFQWVLHRDTFFLAISNFS